MPENNTYDYDLLAAYITRSASEKQQDEVNSRLAAEPDFVRLYRQLLLIYTTQTTEYKFDTEAALLETKKKIRLKPKEIRISYRFLLYAAAVACLIFVSVKIAGLIIDGGEPEKQMLSFASTDRVSQTRLSDGSTVTLNINSEIKYLANFAKVATREIQLRGEAFFEVAHNSDKTFIVTTGETEVVVTGTRFSVSNNTGGDIVVWVEEGSVRVKQLSGGNAIILRAGEKAVCNKQRALISKTTGQGNELFWNQSKLSFFETPLSVACTTIENMYGCSIEIADSSIADLPITSGFTNDEPDNILKVIALTLGLRLEEKENKHHFILYAE